MLGYKHTFTKSGSHLLVCIRGRHIYKSNKFEEYKQSTPQLSYGVDCTFSSSFFFFFRSLSTARGEGRALVHVIARLSSPQFLPGIKTKLKTTPSLEISPSLEPADIVVVIWDQFAQGVILKREQRPLVNDPRLVYLLVERTGRGYCIKQDLPACSWDWLPRLFSTPGLCTLNQQSLTLPYSSSSLTRSDTLSLLLRCNMYELATCWIYNLSWQHITGITAHCSCCLLISSISCESSGQTGSLENLGSACFVPELQNSVASWLAC